mgnify:CR=1 FL=1
MSDKPVVLLAEELSPATVEALGPAFEIRRTDGADRTRLLADIAEVDAILIRSATTLDAEAIAAAHRLKVIARAGVGLDNVDIPAATAAGIMVVNAPTSNIISAAELTVGHILGLLRNISQANASLRAGEWKRSAYTGTELYEKKVGIIGLGRIGGLVAERLAPFGTELLAYDPFVTAPRAASLGVRLTDLETLLAEADVITIHMPKTPETIGMLGAEAFAAMKDTAVVVNVARGGLVDERALAQALKEGQIAGAALDVFETEPDTGLDLVDLPQVVTTPHLGASTREAERNCAIMAADSLRGFLEDGQVHNSVNFPEAVMTRQEGTHRLVIVNRNVPNMVGQVSTIVAQHGQNIANLLNKSRGELAVTLVDVEGEIEPKVLEELRAIDGVLSARGI